jgi:GPI mannosyltransferase 3
VKDYLQTIKNSTHVKLILLFGLIIQIVFCITSVGYFHPDQHFQIIEFSSLQLHKNNAAAAVWELESNIRPTLQVYLFSGFRIVCEKLSVTNPLNQLLILRIIQGLLFWFFLNYISFFYNKYSTKKNLIVTLLIINFSWFLPYSRTLFSSEVTAALIFFPAIFWFHKLQLEKSITFFKLLIIGFLIALSFYLRFQLGFAIAGFFMLLFFINKLYKYSFLILIGFAIGVLLNVFIDYQFYHKIVFTPFVYFKINIIEGVAASFGEKSFFYYLGVLAGVITVVPLSILMLLQYFKISIQKFKHPIVITCLFFLIGHSMVAHKEERFLFTIINILPIILSIGGFDYLFNKYQTSKIYKYIINFSISLNIILLIAFVFIPYSQSIHFINKLSTTKIAQNKTVYCFERNPLQTESKLPLTFYSSLFRNTRFINFNSKDSSLINNKPLPNFIISTYNDLRDQDFRPESKGYTPVLFSSTFLWHLNMLLEENGMNSINDIWVCYQLNK